MRIKRSNKALQAIPIYSIGICDRRFAALRALAVAERQNAVVAAPKAFGAAAVPELGR
jgi:hypothetical protein